MTTFKLICNVCGREPVWSLPRYGDRCIEDDGGTLIAVEADELDDIVRFAQPSDEFSHGLGEVDGQDA